MANVTKTARVLLASTSLAPGGVATSASLPLLSALGGLATLVVTNDATGPAAGCESTLEVSPNGIDWYEYSRMRSGTIGSESYCFQIEIPMSVMTLRAVFSGNTSQNVTVEAFLQELSITDL